MAARVGIALALAVVLLLAPAMPSKAIQTRNAVDRPADGPDIHWVDAWSAAPDSAGPALQAQTIRQIVRTSIGGSRIRLRLSNLFGSAPVTIGPLHVAVVARGSDILTPTDRTVTFAGKSSVTIARGGAAISDPVALPVRALQQLAVSMYLPAEPGRGPAGPSTIHGDGQQTAFISLHGDATAATRFPDGDVVGSRFFLTDVEVATQAPRAIVMFGDSVTDGFGSTRDANARLPDALAARLQAQPRLASVAVVNAGIAGNRVLNDGPVGPSMLARFDRDALDKPGVAWIVLLGGINDIGVAGTADTPQDAVSASQIVGGLRTLVARAHAKRIRVMGGTLTPWEGSEWPFHTAAGEAKRRTVNAWIRSAGAFDGVVDFDAAVRDPRHPDRLLRAFDSGDHLHPNDAGYKAMAAAVDLAAFGFDR